MLNFLFAFDENYHIQGCVSIFSLLEKITSKSSILISCHGAISHVATANNIRQIDIIDKSYDYGKWTCHFRNYKPLYRDSFNFLSNKIVELI